jgi:hypothetical protein
MEHSLHIAATNTGDNNNPVKTGIRSCRVAGDFFYKNGILYRPAQNYSASNERSITLNRVGLFSEVEYVEIAISEILLLKNQRFNLKINTISHTDGIVVIDTCKTY